MKLSGSSICSSLCYYRSSLSSLNKIGNPFPLFFYSSNSAFDVIGSAEDARFTVRQMIRARPKLSVVDYTKLLSTAVNMKDYSYALSLFREMRVFGAPVDIYTMNIAINCCCSLEKSNMGFAVLGCLFKSGRVPDVVTYNTLIKGLFGEDRGDEAVSLFLKLTSEKLCEPCDEFTFSIIINGLCKHGHTVKALEWLRVFEKGIIKPEIHSYNTIVDSLCKDSMLDDAIKLFSEMKDKGITPDVVTYTSLIHGFCNFGRKEKAEVLLIEMLSYKVIPDVHIFNKLVDSYGKEGLVEDVNRFIEMMIKTGVKPNLVTYNALLGAYCLQGEMEEAMGVLSTMISRGCDPDIKTYNTLLNGLVKKGWFDKAFQLYEDIPSYMKKRGFLPNNVTTYNVIIQGFLKKDKNEEAIELINEMKQHGFSLDETTCEIIYERGSQHPKLLSMI